MTIVGTTRLVTGGVDTHLDVHVAAAVDVNSGVLGVESFATTPTGHAAPGSPRSVSWIGSASRAPAPMGRAWRVISLAAGCR